MKRRDVRVNTAAHRPAFDGFVDAFHDAQAAEHWRDHDVLTRWLEAAWRAMRAAVVKGTPAWDDNEDQFARIFRACRDAPRVKAGFARMIAHTVEALEAEPIDFLGPVFAELAADAWMGQFFTPNEVSTMMAEMTMSDAAELAAERVVFCAEPACGVGGMVLAANQVLRRKGVNVATRIHWDAVDVDSRAAHAAYIQINLSGASAVVRHGNSLSLETWWSLPTMAAIAFPKRRPRSEDFGKNLPADPPAIVAPKIIAPPATAQLDLFGVAP